MDTATQKHKARRMFVFILLDVVFLGGGDESRRSVACVTKKSRPPRDRSVPKFLMPLQGANPVFICVVGECNEPWNALVRSLARSLSPSCTYCLVCVHGVRFKSYKLKTHRNYFCIYCKVYNGLTLFRRIECCCRQHILYAATSTTTTKKNEATATTGTDGRASERS